jgi:hypothetical protein
LKSLSDSLKAFKDLDFKKLDYTHSYFITLKFKVINIFFGDIISTSSDRDYDLAYVVELMSFYSVKLKN